MAKKAAPRGASRSQPRKDKRQLPAWLWLFTGLAGGLFIAFLFHLGHMQSSVSVPQDLVSAQKTAQQPAHKRHDGAHHKAKKPLPKFDFYAVLPKKEVVLPNEDETKPASTPQKKHHASVHQPSTASQPQSTTRPSDRDAGQYLLQVGSFRDKHHADRQRAQFTLYGYNVHVQPGALDNGETWYRVMLGPFNSRARLRIAQRKLKQRNVDALAIRLKN